MNAEIRVSFAGLQAASANITSQANKVQGSLDDLKARLAPLVAGWEGGAAEAYNVHQRQWDTAAADLQQVLAAIGTAVQRAADDYADGERQNTARW